MSRVSNPVVVTLPTFLGRREPVAELFRQQTADESLEGRPLTVVLSDNEAISPSASDQLVQEAKNAKMSQILLVGSTADRCKWLLEYAEEWNVPCRLSGAVEAGL